MRKPTAATDAKALKKAASLKAKSIKAGAKKRVMASIRPGASIRKTRSSDHAQRQTDVRQMVEDDLTIANSFASTSTIAEGTRSLSPPGSARPDAPIRAHTLPEESDLSPPAPALAKNPVVNKSHYQVDAPFVNHSNDFVPIPRDNPATNDEYYYPQSSTTLSPRRSIDQEYNDEGEIQEATYPAGGQFYQPASNNTSSKQSWLNTAPLHYTESKGAKPWYPNSAAGATFVDVPAYAAQPQSDRLKATEYRREPTIIEESETGEGGGASSTYSFGSHPKHWTATERDYSLPRANEFKSSFGNDEWANANGGHIEFLDLDYPPVTPGSAALKRRASESFQQSMFDIPKRASIYSFPRRA